MATRETTIRLSVKDNFSGQLGAFSSGLDRARKSTLSLEQAIARERQSLIGSTQSRMQLTESLSKISSHQDLARVSSQRLDDQVRSGNITVAQYNDAMGQLHTRFGLSTEAGRKASAQLAKLESDFAAGKISAKQYADGLSQIQLKSGGVAGALSNLGASVQRHAIPMLKFGITVAAGLGAAMVKLAMDMEQTKVAFTTLIGSEQGAMKHLQELRDFAKKTPFQFTELTQASKKMQAFGFEAEKVIPMMTHIGDAVSALGGSSANIDMVVRALGQVQAKGRVMAQEMLQLTEQGIPAWRYLAEAVGVTQGEVMKLSEKGLIPAQQAIDAILAGMQKDFGGMMAEQAKTAAGQVSNLVDTLQEIGTTIGELVLPALKDFLGTVKAGLDTLARLVNWEKDLHAAFQTHQKDMVGLLFATDDTRIGIEDYNKEIMRSAIVTGDAVAVSSAYNRARYNEMTATELAKQGLVKYGEEYYKVGKGVNLFTEASYEAYRQTDALQGTLTEAARATAYMKDHMDEAAPSVRALTLAEMDLEDRMSLLSTLMAGPVGKEMRSFTEQNVELTKRAEELRSKLAELEEQDGKAVTTKRKHALSTAELSLATLQLAKAQADLAAATDPIKQAQLAVKIEDLQTKIGNATGATQTYIDKSKEIGELQAEYDEVIGAVRALGAEHREATKGIIFDLLQQRVALDGLTEDEFGLLNAVAFNWGLIDKATYDATRSIDGAIRAFEDGDASLLATEKALHGIYVETLNSTDALDENKKATDRLILSGGDLGAVLEDTTGKAVIIEDGFMSAAGAAGTLAEKADKAAKAVALIPDRTVKIDWDIAPMPAVAAPGEPYAKFQHGGFLPPGRPALIHPPEIFVPQQGGSIISQTDTRQMMALWQRIAAAIERPNVNVTVNGGNLSAASIIDAISRSLGARGDARMRTS